MRQRKKLGWIAMAVASLLAIPIGVSSIPAGAAPELQPAGTVLSPQGEVAVDADAHAWNIQAHEQQKVITYERFQYTIYWDSDTHLVLARRNLDADDVQHLKFPHQLENLGDDHRATVLGISTKDGRLHLSYDHHNNQLNYRRSVEGFLTSPPDQLSLEQFGDPEPIGQPGRESSATYPRFFNDSDGDLYFIFRQGASGHGDTLLRRYNSELADWQQTGMLISQEGTYPPWDNSTSRNAYINWIEFDSDDRLHMTWLFRETGADRGSNHDIHYAYSDDFGTTWFNNDGLQIADVTAQEPISLDSPGIVVIDIPIHTGLFGQTGMALDSDNQPHMLGLRSRGTGDAEQHYVHHWRTPDGAWHEEFIDAIDLPSSPSVRGDLVVDEQDNVHAYFPHAGQMFAASATAESGWTDWTFYPIASGIAENGNGADGPRFDRARFERDGVVSLPIETVTDAGTGFTLLEFTIEQEEAAG